MLDPRSEEVAVELLSEAEDEVSSALLESWVPEEEALREAVPRPEVATHTLSSELTRHDRKRTTYQKHRDSAES